MFVDRVKIIIKAGKGGDGAVSFRREKYIPRGGPNGGDGGRGGSVIIQANQEIRSLEELYFHPHQKAEKGENGQGGNKKGKDGADLIIKVPLGTLVEDLDKSELLGDLVEDGQQLLVARGGRGGWGNARFKNSIQQTPRFALKGEPGEEKRLVLTLKVIADIGLVGFPNAGKSTLLSQISSAQPKIADYPFTTLIPCLGVVQVDDFRNFIVADIPGLIEGAHQGSGLGDKFLRHIERTKLILHLIDGSEIKKEDPLSSFRVINRELREFSEELSKKPQIVAINKEDLDGVKKNFTLFKDTFLREGYSYPIFLISALTGEGIKDLIFYLGEYLKNWEQKEKSIKVEVKSFSTRKAIYKFNPPFVIKKKGKVYEVYGEEIERIVAMTDFDNQEALAYFQKKIKKIGLEKALIKKGIKDGEEVKIGEKIFTFFRK
ncbi:MAG: GTPase ObgE [Candidatus Caldatribacteriota bacterium]